MKVANDVAHRALTYVAAVRRQGFKLSKEDFAEYIQNPFQKVKSGFGLAEWKQAITSIFDVTAETTLEWLERLNWLTSKNGFVEVTNLGRAVLSSLDEDDVEADMMELTLGTEDPFSYARVIGRIAQRGDALLVDPYFKLDHLLDILLRTTVRGVLMSPRPGKAEIAALATAMSKHSLDRQFEIRLADDIHDRYVIPREGTVDTIGTSLSGLGKKPTLFVTIRSKAAADELRRTHNTIWEQASPLTPPAGMPTEPAQAAAEPVRSVPKKAS